MEEYVLTTQSLFILMKSHFFSKLFTNREKYGIIFLRHNIGNQKAPFIFSSQVYILSIDKNVRSLWYTWAF